MKTKLLTLSLVTILFTACGQYQPDSSQQIQQETSDNLYEDEEFAASLTDEAEDNEQTTQEQDAITYDIDQEDLHRVHQLYQEMRLEIAQCASDILGEHVLATNEKRQQLREEGLDVREIRQELQPDRQKLRRLIKGLKQEIRQCHSQFAASEQGELIASIQATCFEVPADWSPRRRGRGKPSGSHPGLVMPPLRFATIASSACQDLITQE